MISDKVKAAAIAKLKMNVSIEEVAIDMEIPYPLVKEWHDNMETKDLIHLEANIHACENFSTNVTISSSEQNEKLLKAKLEDVALDIAREIGSAVTLGDMVHSKSLNLLADTTAKLYNTFINKGAAKSNEEPGSGPMTMFESMRRD